MNFKSLVLIMKIICEQYAELFFKGNASQKCRPEAAAARLFTVSSALQSEIFRSSRHSCSRSLDRLALHAVKASLRRFCS